MGDSVPIRGRTAHQSEAVSHFDRTCVAAIGGRRAARTVANWARRFGLTEAELQLLWQLRSAAQDGLDQTALARALAFSPAQISACVERLRTHGHICPSDSTIDRRRRHWQLSAAGRELLDQVLVAATLLRCPSNHESIDLSGDGGREAAA